MYRIFEQLALALKNRVCPKIFHCIEYILAKNIFKKYIFYQKYIWIYFALSFRASAKLDFRETLRLPWKREFTMKFFTARIKSTFYIQDFWATCACPEKQSYSEIFHCIENIFFIIPAFWTTSACPKKTECVTVLNICCLSLRIFEQLALARKTEFPLIFLTVFNIAYLLHSVFFSNLRLPWKFSLYCIFNTVKKIYSIQWKIFEKTEFPLKFFTVLNIFLHSRFLSNLRLPWKTECALNSLYWMYTFYHSGF